MACVRSLLHCPLAAGRSLLTARLSGPTQLLCRSFSDKADAPPVPITELTLLRYRCATACARAAAPHMSTVDLLLACFDSLPARPATSRACWRSGGRLGQVSAALHPRPCAKRTLLPRARPMHALQPHGGALAGHIAHAKAALESGDLLVAGALAEPVDEALFVWKGGCKTKAGPPAAPTATTTTTG